VASTRLDSSGEKLVPWDVSPVNGGLIEYEIGFIEGSTTCFRLFDREVGELTIGSISQCHARIGRFEIVSPVIQKFFHCLVRHFHTEYVLKSSCVAEEVHQKVYRNADRFSLISRDYRGLTIMTSSKSSSVLKSGTYPIIMMSILIDEHVPGFLWKPGGRSIT